MTRDIITTLHNPQGLSLEPLTGALLHKSCLEDSLHESSVIAGVHEQLDPYELQDKNWSHYYRTLKQCGSLSIWFDAEMAWEAKPSGHRGHQQAFSDAAIQACLTMKVQFGLPLRQTTGFVESPLEFFGLDWSVPDFSTLCRQQKTSRAVPAKGKLDDFIEHATNFLTNPWNLWKTGNTTLRRTVLKLAFTDRPKYHRNEGYRTPKTTLSFKVL